MIVAETAGQQQLALFAFNLYLLKGLTSDLREDQLDVRVQGVGHSPRWMLAHLAVSTDYILKCCGRPTLLPEDWHTWFGINSPDSADQAPRPGKVELLRAIEAGHAASEEAFRAADPLHLAQPHPFEQLSKSPLKTFGDVVAHLMNTHAAFHLGQLSAWRRHMGFPALF